MKVREEVRISLTELAKQECVNVSTVWRWAQRGAKGHRLETFCIGGRRYTTQEAFDRFVQRTTQAATGESPKSVKTAEMARAEAEAAAYLDKMGA
jgi:hypothetical protein